MARTVRTRPKQKRVLRTKAQRQQEIISVTVELLAEYGVHGTSISRIASAVGMSRSALYYHFSSHGALLRAAMDAIDETAADWIATPTAENAPACLEAIGRAHSTWTLSARNTFLRPFYQMISSNRDDSLTAAVSTKRKVYLDRLVEYAEEGKREGTIRSDADSREIARCILLHAWGEDVAFLMGAQEFLTEGVSHRLLHRLLAVYAVPSSHETPDLLDGEET